MKKTIKVWIPIKKLTDSGYISFVTRAPEGPVSESNMGQEYSMDDNEQTIDVTLVTMARLLLKEISSIVTLPMAGIAAAEFIQLFMVQYPSANMETEIAVYIYKKNNNG